MFVRNENNLRKFDDYDGAPLFRARYRCTDCGNPVQRRFHGPQGKCYKCEYDEQDIAPIDRIEAVGIYFPERDWDDAEGPIIDELIRYAKEIWEAKEGHHTDKMADILLYGIIERNWDNFDLILFPPSTRTENHMIPKARVLEDILGIPYEDAIVEVEETPATKTMSADERRESAEDNHVCQTNVEGERVLIIDDVAATMSIITETARAIKEKGASQIVAVTMSRSVDLWELQNSNLIEEVE